MTTFKTGVHTIEFKTTNLLDFPSLPPAYRAAIRPEGMKPRRYIMNMTKLPGMQEYSTPADTQRAIEDAFILFANTGAGYPVTTRIDYRFDDHNCTYADHLHLMTVLVNLIAHKGGVYDRRVFYADGNDVKTSVRCMPDDKDTAARYGVEYYDKFKQKGNNAHGYARLELRRLNMEGETVQFVVQEWRNMLKRITQRDYRAMLEAHVEALHALKTEDESPGEFVKRIRGRMIAREEETKLYKISGKTANHYHGEKMGLPSWKQVKPFIDGLIAQLDEALNQSTREDYTANGGDQIEPF